MKKSVFIFLLNLFCSVSLVKSQIKINNDCKPFNLTVHVNNLDTGKIRIMYNNCNDTTARYTANLKNGEATFSGFIDNVSEALLVIDLTSSSFSLDGPKVIRFIMEAKPMKLSYSVNNSGAYDIRLDGSNSQKELEEWQNKNKTSLNLIDMLRNKLSENLSAGQKAIIITQLDSAYLKITDKVKNHVFYNRESNSSVYLLKQYWRSMPIDTLKAYYSQLSTSAQYNQIGKNLLDDILTLSAKDDAFVFKYGSKNLGMQLKTATNFLDFSLKDFNGKAYKLKAFENKYTFLNIWASWCEPCIKNMPEYEKMKVLYKDQPINFVSISIDKNTANWKRSVQQNKLSGYNLIDADGILKSFYEITAVPFYLLIKPDGNLANSNISKPGSMELIEIIDNYLKN